MADTFLTIQGLEGDVTHPRFLGSVAVVSWTWGALLTGSTPGTQRTDVREFTITKLVDSVSPSLFRHCVTGKPMPRVTLSVIASTGQEPLLEITLHDVRVSAVSVSSTQGRDIFENVNLLFARFDYSYVVNRSAGRVTGRNTFSWSLVASAPIGIAPGEVGSSKPRSKDTKQPIRRRKQLKVDESAPTPLTSVEQIRFRVFHPQRLSRERWARCLVYIHTPQAQDDVDVDSRTRLRDATTHNVRSARATRAIPRGAEVLIVPELPGAQFNPPSQRVLWLEEWHCAEFRVRTSPDRPEPRTEEAVNGRVAFYLHTVLIGEVAFWGALDADSNGDAEEPVRTATGSVFNSIFVSYCHQDTVVVEQLAKAYKALPLTYLRDVEQLRAGEEWSTRLRQMICDADVFQLYWSRAASRSTFVKREWRAALRCPRAKLICPVYWERPMPAPPPELAGIHFHFIEGVHRNDDVPS
jgi:type VI secretion system secreted protein Hcp